MSPKLPPGLSAWSSLDHRRLSPKSTAGSVYCFRADTPCGPTSDRTSLQLDRSNDAGNSIHGLSGGLDEREHVQSIGLRGYHPKLNVLPVRRKSYPARFVPIQLLAGHRIGHVTDLHLLPHVRIERFLPTDALTLAVDDHDGVRGRAREVLRSDSDDAAARSRG